jgi:hypothetical protein
MKKYVWPLLIIFFLAGGLVAILIGEVVLPPEPRPEPVEAISEKWTDSGHADRESESFVHWDEDDPPEVPTNCAKCHSAYGYLDYLGEDGSTEGVVDEAATIGSVVNCYVCHNPTASEKDTAIFPSGAEISCMGQTANCAECHQGRTSTLSVENAIAGLPEDEVNEELGFINTHYKIAAAVRYGTEVQAGYEYPNMDYVGFYEHVEDYQLCTDCHDPHSLEIEFEECSACHSEVNPRSIRIDGTDYDGDGDITEGIYGEITTIHDMLYDAIQTYAAQEVGESILYASQFPYWFIDSNGNGEADDGEVAFPNQYVNWTPRLVKATYNYHMVLEDPGSFIHNAKYIIQIMYDTLEDLSQVTSVDMSGLERP